MLCLFCFGCRSPVQAFQAGATVAARPSVLPTPEALFDEIERFFISGDLASAQRAAESAIDNPAFVKTPWAARFHIERARIALYRGENSKIVAILKPEFAPSSPPETQAQRDLLLAIALDRLGDRSGADDAVSAAESLHLQGVVAAESFGVRGSIALERGQLKQAESMFRTALEAFEQTDAKFYQTQMLMNLGVIAEQQEHFEEALDRFHRASTIAQSIGAKLTLQYALANLGFVYYDTGDFARARDTTIQAAAEAAALGVSLNQIQCLRGAGLSAFRLNDVKSARSFYEQALALAQKVDSTESIFSMHQELGKLLLHSDPKLAAFHIHEATRLASLGKISSDMIDQQFAEALLLSQEGDAKRAETGLRLLANNPQSTPSRRWEAEGLLANLYEQQHDQTQAGFWFRRALDTFRRQRLSLHTVDLKLPFLGNGDDLYFAYMDHLIRLGKTHEALDLLDRSRAETLTDGLELNRKAPRKALAAAPTTRALAARLHATILVYSLRPGESYLWSITPTAETFHRLPGRETLLPLIKRHSEAILGSVDLLAKNQSTGRQLFDALVQPAALNQPGRVYIIADRELNDLNFETVIPPAPTLHYWIEDVTLTNARSLRLLAASATPQPQKQNALLIGDPIYRDTEYPALPNASTELTGIAQHFPPDARTVFSGSAAVPAAYAASMPAAYSYIHFVAHATSNETSPLDSAIVLSKSPTQPFAYRLYARDILDRPLHANLVTLSACYGSGRRNYSGEGLVGLAWAFLRAGAHNVIGALWEVSDASTPQLMDRLYTGLLAGEPPDTALRAAKLATIHAGGAFRKPLYWAPFQIYSGS